MNVADRGRSSSERPQKAAGTGTSGLSPSTLPTGAPGEEEPPREQRTTTGGTSSPSRAKKRARRRLVLWLKRLALAGLVLAAAGTITLAVVVRRIEGGLPSVADLRKGYRPPQVTRVLAKDGSLLAELYTERRTVVKLDKLPAHVKLAVLAAEDAGFYEHQGLDYIGIARAVWVNLRNKKTKQGASTITQQVVKNLLLDNQRTYRRKIREILLARRIEQELSKDEILELYLNHIYFGAGRYGIEEAALGYFGKHAAELTVAQAALLAGLPASPNGYNPRINLEAAKARRTHVLGQLRAKNFIDATTYDAAMVEQIHLAPAIETGDDLAPEVVELVRKTIKEVAGEEAARKGGFTVETTIDPALQRLARTAVRDGAAAYDKRWKLLGPFPPYPADGKDPKTKKKLPPQEKPFEGTPRYGHGDVYVGVVVGHDDLARTIDVAVGNLHGVIKLEAKDRYAGDLAPSAWAALGTRLRVSLLAPPPTAPAAAGSASGSVSAVAPVASSLAATPAKVPLRLELGPEAAFVAIDVRTKRVLALVGNIEGVVGGLDRASHAHRQPGSTFKPFVYGAALAAKKYTPASLVEATAATFGGYHPKNYEAWTKDEPVRLRDALAQSINMVAVRVAADIGPQMVVDFAHAAGISAKLQPDLAIALGAYEVTPLELAGAYTTIASGGIYEAPQILVRIVGPDGKELALPARKPPQHAFGEAEAYVLTSMMTSVVERGTAQAAKVLGRPLAGKTGTSNAAKDTWFAGFSTDVVAVSWVGYDDGKALGAGEAGARTALPAWIAWMKQAQKDRPKAEFPRPAGVVTVKIDPKTGKLPYPDQEDSIDEIFLVGTEPKETADPPTGKKSPLPPEDAPEDPWATPPSGSASTVSTKATE